MRIKNFIYNGFMGELKKGFASYTGKFIEWTDDPGIVRMKCSDGKERLVPSFAIVEVKDLPPAPIFPEGSKVFYWGQPSKS